MRYTLIGGAGFVGRNVTRHLREHGHQVRVIDNLTSYHGGRLPRGLVCEDLLIKPCGEIVSSDIDGSDVVVHLASKQDYWPHYSQYIENNNTQLARLFEQELSGIGRFVLFSSQTVYGEMDLPYCVERVPLLPTEQYGLSKYFQERICRLFCPRPLFIIRPTIILGPGQNGKSIYAGIVKNTVARLHAGMPPMIFDDGEQLRCYVNVQDVAGYVMKVGEEPDGLTRIVNGTSSEGPQTVNWLVDRIQRIMDTKVEPVRNKYIRTADEKQRHCISYCECPELFGPAATGDALIAYVESLLTTELPTREEIEAVDRQNLKMGVIREA